MSAAVLILMGGEFLAHPAPAPHVELALMLLLAWLLLAGYGALRLFLRVVLGMSYGVKLRGHKELAGWLVPPLLAVLAVAIVTNDVPFKLAFSASRAELETFAKSSINLPTPPPQFAGVYSRVGWYTVGPPEPLTAVGGVRFAVKDVGFISTAGFAYLPVGPPRVNMDGAFYRHLEGRWYWYNIHW